MSEQQVTQGVVSKISAKGDALEVGGIWYSFYRKDLRGTVNRNDTVSIKFTTKPKNDGGGYWYNGAEVTVLEKGAPVPSGGGSQSGGGGDKQFRSVPELTRIDALGLALKAHAGNGSPVLVSGDSYRGDVSDVLKTADVFVAYIEGKLSTSAPAEQAPPAPEPAPAPAPVPEPAPLPASPEPAVPAQQAQTLDDFLG